MKTKYTIGFFFFLTIAIIAAFKADDDPFSVLLKKMAAYNEKNPQEKVHLHLDKPYYAIGDDIWFKAYVVNTLTGAPSDISQALYVELIDESDSIKKQLKLPVMGGTTWGDFKLADSLTEGNYRIRAYTQFMRNAGPEFFYDKTIRIGNSWANNVFTNVRYEYITENSDQKVNTQLRFADKKGLPYANSEVSYVVQLDAKNVEKDKATTNQNGEVNFSFIKPAKSTAESGKITATLTLPDKKKIIKIIPVTLTSAATDIQFFPEGGSMVNNLPIKVAVKSTKRDGLGKDISGMIVDETGTEITRFNTTYLGMGSFIINPQPGHDYTAIVKNENGTEQKVNLPQALATGYQVIVNNMDSNKVAVRVLLSAELMGKGELKLVAQHQGEVYASVRIKTDKQVTLVSIPKQELPTGILQLTLFDPANNPVAERLVFVDNPAEVISLQLKSDKKEYTAREKVRMELKGTLKGKPAVGSFSVSVTNTAVVEPDLDNESNILTTLLLTSDLSGYIEKPNHYFKDRNKSTLQALDHLLLTQGWRRFIWKNVIEDKMPPVSYKPETSLSISGTLTTLGGKPIPNGKVSLFSSSGGLLAIDTVADANGRFVFDNLVFGDSTKFVVQGRTTKDKKNTEIKLDIIPGQVVTRNKNTGDIEVNINESISAYIQQSESYFDELTKRGLLQHTQMLKEINIVERRNPTKNSSNLNGAGRADVVITADQLTTSNTLEQSLQGKVAGLIFKNGLPHLSRFGAVHPMQVILDGMFVETDFMNMINVQDVETIEVLKSASNLSIYGSRGGAGIIIITTKRGGGFSGSSYTPGIITYVPKGYNASREFYVPKYDVTNNSTLPDLRTTVYWNPQLISDSTGTAKFEYFNADTKGTYRVLVEGINAVGQLGRTVYTYEVK